MENSLKVINVDARVTGDGSPLVLPHSLLADRSGFADVVCRHACSATSREVVAGLPNATLTILESLAHVPLLQTPRRFLDAVVPFLS